MRKYLLVALVLGLVASLGAAKAAPPPPGPIEYVTVDDGTEIAVRVYYPDGYDPNKTYPALVEMEGYGGAAAPNDNSYVGSAEYVVVGISVRGTGCSAGQLELFSERSSKDGAWIIDNWIPEQSWSNGMVGIYGHSYGGLTGFLVAAEVPDTTHLKAVAVSGLIDDFYRGILYIGGIPNPGFPILWGAGVRPLGEHSSNLSWMLEDQHCLENYLDHQGSSTAPTPQIFLDTYGSREATPDSWAIQSGLMNHIADIKAPIQLGQQYQDEQTGPRGGHVLWENIPRDVPKRILLSTGRHNPNDPNRTKKDWLDCWILHDGNTAASATSGASCADVLDPEQRVMLNFESMGSNRLPRYTSSDWPLPETDWQRFNLCATGTLSQSTDGCDGEMTYLSTGTGRHMTLDVGNAVPTGAPLAPYGFTTGLPDTARYELPVSETTVLAGPLELSLHATATSADVDFWVEILDVAPGGETTFVQRGLLRSSYRELDEEKSAKTPGGDMYRPYHDYVGAEPILPGTAYRYEIEIFPLGHVWRAGHTLVLQVHAPPTNDPISTYAYEPNQASVVTILQDADHRTSVLLPFLHGLDPQHYRAETPACGSVNGEVCITPALG
jgi:hypothetical protein